MLRILSASLISLLALATASAHSNNCADRHAAHTHLAKGASVSPLENDYDVQTVKIDLAMTNLSTSISGNAVTSAKVLAPSGLSQYAFELDTVLSIDSIKINGAAYTAASSGGYLRTVNLSSALPTGSIFTAQVWYHGTPPAGNGFFTRGIVHSTLGSGTQITYTLSDPYLAKDWWPCKQSLSDKIDQVEMWITVPAGMKAGANGLLQQVTPVGSSMRYEWKTRYATDYYLICASVAPYSDYSRYMHFTGSTDTMLVQHFLYDTATVRPLFQSALDSTGILVDFFSTLYGRYPFWQEKYGHCFSNLGGGMEHQTMTTIGVYDMPLIAHELGHQWWGDAVTYNAWKDIWLSEGWATYTEHLFVERYRGVPAMQAYRTSQFNQVLSQPGGSVIVDDTNNVYRIFDARLTYYKGAAVGHMLRYVFDDNVAFYNGLQAYQQQYRYRTATTADFKAVMETAYGHPLDTFFNQWVYGEGYPTFGATWNQAGNTVFVQLTQTTSMPSSVSRFHTPLEIKLHGATRDTVVKVYAADSVQLFSFIFSDPLISIAMDPYNQILNKTGPLTRDSVLAVKNIAAAVTGTASPNPAKDAWIVKGLAAGAALRLFDTAGKLIWSGNAATAPVSVPCGQLAPGIYQLQIKGAGGTFFQSMKLQKI